MGIFEKFQLCRWEVTGYGIVIPVGRIEEDGGNRLVRFPRPEVDGEKVDDTGGVAKTYTLIADFYNGIDEPGMPSDDMYPDLLNNLIKSFDVHECGTLTLPHIGPRRCRAWTYKRIETSDERDCGLTTLVFLADNEAGVTAATFTSPSARSVSAQLVGSTQFSADQAGVGLSLDEFGTAMNELASEIEGLANAPFEYVNNLETQAKRINTALRRIEKVHTRARDEVGKLLLRPEQSLLVRKIHQLRDLHARLVAERLASLPKLLPIKVPGQRTIFDVAAEHNQDATELMRVNSHLPDLLKIREGSVVNVFQ